MIKKCVRCGKEFESYDKNRGQHTRLTMRYKRPFNAITCSSKCSRNYDYYRNFKHKEKLLLPNKVFLAIIFSIFLISLASSEIDLTNGGTTAYKKGGCVELQQTCSNCTFVNVSTVTYPNSTLIFINNIMTKTGTKYNYSFCITDSLGKYRYSVLGDKNGVISTEEGFFEVTYTGDILNTQKSILYVALSGILIFFFILIIYFAGKLPDSETRNDEGELIDINNLKYLGSVLIFVDWMIMIAIFYLTSNLAYAYLGEVLFADILFMLFKVCFSLTLPLVVIWFIWIFYQIFRDKKLKRMISKGIYPMGRKF